MKILLIAPSSGNWKGIAKSKFFNGKTFRFSMLPLLSVAALTPTEHEVTIIDEQIENLPSSNDFDLVGVTAMTALAPRAYQISKHFKDLGITTVIGGFHATLNPEEALKHFDCVVSGPAYNAWDKLLLDFQNGDLKRIYYGNAEKNIPEKLPRHLLAKENYLTVNATFATLGCKNSCNFCSVNEFYKMNRFYRNIEHVANEIKNFKEKFLIFIDDNLIQDREYAIDLFKAIKPLNKKWVTQVSIDISNDEELLKMMAEAGCMGVFIGLETFSEEALNSQKKNINSPEKYKEAIKKIHKYGIYVESGIIFGFDSDDKTVFNKTLKTLDKIGIDLIQLSILTPIPGTILHKNMEERIFDKNLEHYDYRHTVFYPAQMNSSELQNGADWVIRKFYSPFKIIKRIFRWLTVKNGFINFIFPLVLSAAYYGRVKRFKIYGFNPAD